MNRLVKQMGLLLGIVFCAVTWTAPAAAAPAIAVPERSRVCMMQDTVMAVPAIPLAGGGKTYYGCCEMCKARIEAEPERYTRARDPLSGAVVDKATAPLLGVDGRVLYFESDASRTRFFERLSVTSPASP